MKIINTLSLLGLMFIWSCSSEEASVKMTAQTLRISVYASAKVVPNHEITYFSAQPGIVETIMVSEGDTVPAGGVMIHLNSEIQQLNQQSAALQKSIAQKKQSEQWATLQNLQQNIDLLKEKMIIDSTEFESRSKLWQQNIGSKKELDMSKIQYQKSKNDYEGAVKQYELTATELRDQYRIAVNQYQQANKSLNDLFIAPKKAGKVYDILVDEGQFVTSNTPLVYFGDADDFIIELQIDESDISKIKLGQGLYLSLDAFPETIFEAEISKIYPSKVDRTQTFRVEAQFKDKGTQMYKGLNGEANIVISEAPHVWCLPRAYVNDGKVITDDGEVKVVTGAANYDWIEIQSGLDTNTLIYLPE